MAGRVFEMIGKGGRLVFSESEVELRLGQGYRFALPADELAWRRRGETAELASALDGTGDLFVATADDLADEDHDATGRIDGDAGGDGDL